MRWFQQNPMKNLKKANWGKALKTKIVHEKKKIQNV